MKNKKLLLPFAALLILTLVLAVYHRTTRTPEIPGELLVDGSPVSVKGLAWQPVTGTVITAGGEERPIDAQGIEVSALCPGDVRVTSSDEYAVTVSEGESAYLIVKDDGSVQLVVFGDGDARRCVKNVVRLDSL